MSDFKQQLTSELRHHSACFRSIRSEVDPSNCWNERSSLAGQKKEKQLLGSARAGNPEAFEKLIIPAEDVL